jgi:hypothetical protein
MKGRWTTLLTVTILPFLLVSFLSFDVLHLISTETNLPTSFLYWTVFYAGVLILIYGYPRLRYNHIATFHYWKKYLDHIYPLYQYPIRFSIASLSISALIITALVADLIGTSRQKWLIVITAFYASVLFFREIFSSEIPVLKMDNLTRIGAGMGNQISFETDIGNVGGKTSTDPTVKFRVYDLNGRPLTDPMDGDLPSGNRALDPGEWTDGRAVSVYFKRDDITENPPETVCLHIKAYDGFGFALLADNRIQKIDIPEQTW